jgi:hypothetical protein
MTALADTRAAGRAGNWRLRRLARLAWVSWRQHRGTLIGLAVLVAALAAFTVTDGLWTQGVTNPLGSCIPPGSPVPCQLFLNGQIYGVWYSGILVPIAVGTFVGAPLLAREYASGTTRFAWTQGTGRTRLTVAQLILVALAVLAAGALLGGLARWASQPSAGQQPTAGSSWIPVLFNSSPVAEAAAAVLCFAVGVLAGVLIRRVVPAMAATAAVIALPLLGYARLYYWMLGIGLRRGKEPAFGASQLTARAANPHVPGGRFSLHTAVGRDPYWPPAVRWLDQGWYADAHGHPLRGAALARVLHHPGQLNQLHDTFWVTYQPVNRYWLFQSVQGGAELLLALLLGALAVWLVRRRKA